MATSPTPSGNPTSLYEAALAGDVDALAMALSAHARLGDAQPLNEPNADGWAPLHCAAVAGDAQPVGMLLTAGARINAKTSPAEDTPLHFACAWDHRAVVDALLRRGAYLEQKNAVGATPLHKAAEYSADSAAAVLLERGASCDVPDSLGRTPLHVAAKHNASAIVLDLLAAGADTDAKDSMGRTPVELASGPTRVLLTPSSDDHPTHVWLQTKGLLPHAELFRSYGVAVAELIQGVDEQKLKDAGMPVGVRLKVLRLMKELDEAERGREGVGATSHGNAVAKPLGEVDWQMTEGGEWFRNDPVPTVSSPRLTGVTLGGAPLHVIDPWDYTEMEFTQKYGAVAAAQRSPAASQRAASPALSAASARSGSSSRRSSPSPVPSSQPEPEPEPERASSSLKSRAPPIPHRVSGGSYASAQEVVAVPSGADDSFDAPWDNDSEDNNDEQPAGEEHEAKAEDGVRPWFRRAVMTE